MKAERANLGSSQYFLTGQQLLERALRLCRTQSQRDSILSLGGNECKTATDFDVDQYAYVVVPIWCAPADDSISIPLPTDLLSQQVQITATLAPTSSFWVGPIVTGSADVAPPSALDTAFFQVEQLQMSDRGMSLANHEDMMTHAYGMPMPTFDQQGIAIPLQATTALQQVALTGFRAGSVKRIQLWLTKNSDALNPGRTYIPSSVQALYAGTIYANYEAGTSQIFNLLDSTAPAAVNASALSQPVNPGPFVSEPILNQWVELPFGQPTGNDYSTEVLSEGKEVTNGIVNLQLRAPTADAYTLRVVYVYNATLVFSKGSAEFLF